jgi:hypothetical protein
VATAISVNLSMVTLQESETTKRLAAYAPLVALVVGHNFLQPATGAFRFDRRAVRRACGTAHRHAAATAAVAHVLTPDLTLRTDLLSSYERYGVSLHCQRSHQGDASNRLGLGFGSRVIHGAGASSTNNVL